MAEEPIRVSSKAWTGFDQAPAPEKQPEPQHRPNRLKGLLAAVAIAVLSGLEVASAITKHVVHRRADLVSRVTTVRQGEHPTLFSWHASFSFVMLLVSVTVTIAILVDFWRDKIGGRTSWFDPARRARIDKGG